MRATIIVWALCFVLMPAAHARDLTEEGRTIIESAGKHVLKVPDGARFKWAPLADSAKKVRNDLAWYCAWVDAKNSMGEYIGYMPFEVIVVVSPDGRVVGAVMAVDTSPAVADDK